MADVVITRIWRNRLLFVGLAFLVVFGRLLPLDAGPERWPGPDLILLLAYAWVRRRPDYVPVGLVAVVVLMTDVMFMRPLGLWTACVILGLEYLRSREVFWRDLPYLGEWMMVGATIIAITMANSAVLALFAVQQPALGLLLLQAIVTVLAYPLVEIFSSRVLGFRKMAPGAVDQLGRKL